MANRIPLELPKAKRHDVHRASGPWARGSGGWEYSISEREYDNMLFISGSAKPPEHSWVMGDDFTGLIALRVSEGWSLLNATDTSATLVRHTATYSGNAAKLT